MLQDEEYEYITEREASAIKVIFEKYIQSYKERDASQTDIEWLEQLFKSEFPKMEEDTIKLEASEIIEAINNFDRHLESVNLAAKKGVSKEKWLADEFQDASTSMSVNEYGKILESIDDMLYKQNLQLDHALRRSQDGHIKKSLNLDGIIAENMIAQTAELSGFLQGKNIKVEVRDVFTENSVDVRATNLKTGKYQNYQLKYGKNANATINLIERGNYNNQQLIVPSEQLEDVQAHFKLKKSNKTISDHINAWGAKGNKFTKSDMKELQQYAQQKGVSPVMDYNHFRNRDLAMSIGKNASAMALQSAAVTTGINLANKVFKGERIEIEEVVEVAIKSGIDTSVKVVTSATLQVAVRKGLIKSIPKMTPTAVITNIVMVGIENMKILTKIASGELSFTKGLDQMGRVTTSMVVGLYGISQGAAIITALTTLTLGAAPVIAVLSGYIGVMLGYYCGSKLGNSIYNIGKKVASFAKNAARTVMRGIMKTGQEVANGIKEIVRSFTEFLGF